MYLAIYTTTIDAKLIFNKHNEDNYEFSSCHQLKSSSTKKDLSERNTKCLKQHY
jgi:hypothetical protein